MAELRMWEEPLVGFPDVRAHSFEIDAVMKLPCLAIGLLVLSSALSSCKDREPMPVHTIVIRSPGNGFLYDGIPMMSDQLKTELVVLADANRASPGASVRAYLRIRTEDGVDYDRVYEWVNTCNSLGLDKIETAGH